MSLLTPDKLSEKHFEFLEEKTVNQEEKDRKQNIKTNENDAHKTDQLADLPIGGAQGEKIKGGPGLNKTGAGTLTLNGTNTYLG